MIRKPVALLALACALGIPVVSLLSGPDGQAPHITDLPMAAANAADRPAEMPAVPSPEATGPATMELPATGNAPANAGPATATPAAELPSASPEAQEARGVVRAVNQATLSAGMAAEILKMPVTEGSSFKKGDLLAEFNCERPQAESRAANAAMDVEQKTVETNEELERFNSIGKFDLLISVSKLNKAKAEYEALQAQIKECKIFAPFSGRVIERMTQQYESVSVGEPLLKIVDTGALELDLIVPSRWLQWLKTGSRFSFKVDETGQSFDGVVDRLLPSVDPVSKTLKIIGRFTGKSSGKTIPGMSGTAHFENAG